jgi:hypothetical protein
VVIASTQEREPLAKRPKDSNEAAMSKQTIGPREAALRAMRENKRPAPSHEAVAAKLPVTSSKKPVKRKAKR